MAQTLTNQTHASWLEYADEENLGTGLFLIRQGGGYRKDLIPDITYHDLSLRLTELREVVAFKWIPHIVATLLDVKKALNNRCGNGRCRQTCIRIGCTCTKGQCQ